MLLLLEPAFSPAPPDGSHRVKVRVRYDQRLHPAVPGDDADTEAVLQLPDLSTFTHVPSLTVWPRPCPHAILPALVCFRRLRCGPSSALHPSLKPLFIGILQTAM